MGIQAISPFDIVPKDIVTIIVTLVGDPSTTSRISKRFNEIEWETTFYRDYENTLLKKSFDKAKQQLPQGTKRQIVRFVYERIIKKVRFLPMAQELLHQSEFSMQQAENSFTVAGNCKLSAWRLLYLNRLRKEKEWESSTNAFKGLSSDFLDSPAAIESRIWLKAQGLTRIYEQNKYLIRSWIKVHADDLSSRTEFSSDKSEICFLPKWLGQLELLRDLHIRNSSVRYIPDQIGNLKHLEEIWLVDNKITVLPESLFKLKNLLILNLDSNCIKKVPKKISELISLRCLFLHNNQIEELPDEIGSLPNLVFLIISYNQLKKLPQSMCDLVNLKELNLKGNPLEEFSKQLLKLKKLDTFPLDENLTKVFLKDEDFKRWKFGSQPSSSSIGIFSTIWNIVASIFSALFYSVRSWGTRCFGR